MKLGFVCINYFSFKDCEKYVESLLIQKDFNDYIIVIVDNNSDEINKLALLKISTVYTNVKIIFNISNIGYFPGLNVGIHHIMDNYTNIQALVIGNNDLTFPKDFSQRIYNRKDLLTKVPVISPNIITKDGEHQNPHVITKISFFREVIYDIYYSNFALANIISRIASFTKSVTDRSDEKSFDKAQFINQGHGSCYILSNLFFEHFHELLAPTFLMYEELFLSYQLNTKDFQVYYEPSIVVNHSWHSSFNNIPKKQIWIIARKSHRISRKYFNPYKLKTC